MSFLFLNSVLHYNTPAAESKRGIGSGSVEKARRPWYNGSAGNSGVRWFG